MVKIFDKTVCVSWWFRRARTHLEMFEVSVCIGDQPVYSCVEQPAHDKAKGENDQCPTPFYIDEGSEYILEIPKSPLR